MQRPLAPVTTDEARNVVVMQDELIDALKIALHELRILPEDTDGALMGLYAVMDDVQAALNRTEALDRSRAA
ncbi:MAG: hypothetical protein P8099_10920 [Gemmatimonadota bacterium]